LIKRGERSAIGIYGFERGGFIVEGGKSAQASGIAPLIGRYEFPQEWRIVLVQAPEHDRWHGRRERQAFDTLAGPDRPGNPDALCRLILLGMVPALIERDLSAFSECLFEYNARSGEMFSSIQGGTYTSQSIAALVEKFRGLGVRGVGQSSWGPTVFAIVGDVEQAGRLQTKLDFPTIITRAAPLSDG
jgi:beta-RFAP synthase